MKSTTLSVLLGAGLLVLALGACSSDDDGGDAAAETTTTTAAAVTLESYCADVQAAGESGDPGFDQFFTDHPDPTLDDWAAFLPDVIDGMTATIGSLDEIEPATEAADAHAEVIAAMTTVRDSFTAALTAAEAGDQEAFDAEEAANQDENTPAMEAAFSTVGELCGIDG